MRILIADDHAIVREGLKRILGTAPDPVAIGEARDGAEVVERVRNEKWDVVLLDIAMPGKNGLDALKQIRALSPSLPVLVLSVYPEDQYAVRVLRAGAAGYLTKESAPDELLAAVRKVARGGRYISATLAEQLAGELGADRGELPHERLSDREFQVLRLIASGMTLTQIAEELPLSVKTVSTYRSRILEKMRLRNNAELTHYAIRNGLV